MLSFDLTKYFLALIFSSQLIYNTPGPFYAANTNCHDIS